MSEAWDEQRVVSRDVSPEAFMEELCNNAGGYSRFFWTLTFHYFGWWAAVVAVPALFLDHHRCEVRMPYFAWILYGATVFAMLTLAVLLELSLVQRLGLIRAGDLSSLIYERRWQLPLLGTVLWKLDTYTDVAFIFIARDCGSDLWWASVATFVFGVIFGQLLFNTCFACSDCDHNLPASLGFFLLDFKLVNTAVRQVLPFDPDASHLPVARPVTLRTSEHLIGIEKVVSDVAQVSIQSLFLINAEMPHGFVVVSVLAGVCHGLLCLCLVLRECVQDEVAMQAQGIQQGTALLPGAPSSSPAAEQMPQGSGSSAPPPAPAPSVLGRSVVGGPGSPSSVHGSSARLSGRTPEGPKDMPDLL